MFSYLKSFVEPEIMVYASADGIPMRFPSGKPLLAPSFYRKEGEYKVVRETRRLFNQVHSLPLRIFYTDNEILARTPEQESASEQANVKIISIPLSNIIAMINQPQGEEENNNFQEEFSVVVEEEGPDPNHEVKPKPSLKLNNQPTVNPPPLTTQFELSKNNSSKTEETEFPELHSTLKSHR